MTIPFLDARAGYLADRDELDAAYARVMDSGRWILGQELAAFEAEFAAYCGTTHGIGVANGLDALQLALAALGVGPGDEVVVPAHTFVATWIAVVQTGATPVAVEPADDGFLPSVEAIAAAIGPRTRAVIAVHLYGSVEGIDAIAALCAQRGIALVEDAAQAHGASSGGIRAGAHGRLGCFSFYPGKNLGAYGDGGAVVTSDPELATRLRAMRNYGGIEKYAHDEPGTNSRLDELQAAFLRVRLRGLDRDNARRARLAQVYRAALADVPGLALPAAGAPGSHAWHLFVVRSTHRDALQAHLARNGCQTLIHYPRPVYRYAPYAAMAPATVSPADRLCAEVLSLPIGPHLAEDQVRAVCALVAGFQASSDHGAERVP
jgi:dTDP-3-amino-3,4,6-trideoxy-alpha-D-glucose transaminase